jgi:hypothetical protein
MSRPLSIYSLQEQALGGPNIGIYAWPGSGKTGLFADAGPDTLIMDSDIRGSDTAAVLGSRAHAAQVSDYHGLEEIYDYLRNEDHPYKTVAWDSVTLFQDRTLIDEILRDAYEANPAKQSPDVPSMREYLVSQNRIGRYIRQFSELPITFVCTFHVMSIETPEGEIMYAPLLQGKEGEVSTKISGYFNVLGHFYKKKEVIEADGNKRNVEVRYCRFVGNDQYVAKDRYTCLPRIMKDPTIGKILKAIDAKREQIKAANERPSPPPAAKKAAVRVPKKVGAVVRPTSA